MNDEGIPLLKRVYTVQCSETVTAKIVVVGQLADFSIENSSLGEIEIQQPTNLHWTTAHFARSAVASHGWFHARIRIFASQLNNQTISYIYLRIY
jgi:hypothetical protein